MTVATMDDSVIYDTKITCAKIPVLNTLLLTRFTASPSHPMISIRSYFKLKGGLPDPKGSLSTCLPTPAIALANKAVEKAIMDKDLGKKHCQFFIFLVASNQSCTQTIFRTIVWA